MADRIELFHVTTDADTAKTSPTVTDLVFTDGIVTELQLLIPDGPSGLVGIAMQYGGERVIPSTDEFIVSNNERITWPLDGFPTGRQWQAVSYNTDVYDHTIEVRFLVNEFPTPELATLGLPLPIDQSGQLIPEA